MQPFSRTIAVYGSSAITQDSQEAQQAYRLGQLLAQHKYTICNGGYMGVMEACSRGANEAGGQIIGVTCNAFSKRSPNPYLTEVQNQPDLPARITTLMRIADAYVILNGNIGTLAELFLAWNVKATGWDKPVIVVGEKLRKAIFALQDFTEICQKQFDLLDFVESENEVIDVINSFFGEK
jgi:uncharacterized protein (TIGR00725 family)